MPVWFFYRHCGRQVTLNGLLPLTILPGAENHRSMNNVPKTSTVLILSTILASMAGAVFSSEISWELRLYSTNGVTSSNIVSVPADLMQDGDLTGQI